MVAEPTLRRALLAVVVLGVIAAGLATTAGLVLAREYRPSIVATAGSTVPRGTAWETWHRLATVVLLICGFGVLLVALLRSRAGGLSKKQLATALVGSVVAVGAAAATLLTQRRVEWGHLILLRVASGAGVSGYWTAAFNPAVVGVDVHGVQVSQSHYQVVLLVFLAAPVVAAAALGAVGVEVWRVSNVDDDRVVVTDR